MIQKQSVWEYLTAQEIKLSWKSLRTINNPSNKLHAWTESKSPLRIIVG